MKTERSLYTRTRSLSLHLSLTRYACGVFTIRANAHGHGHAWYAYRSAHPQAPKPDETKRCRTLRRNRRDERPAIFASATVSISTDKQTARLDLAGPGRAEEPTRHDLPTAAPGGIRVEDRLRLARGRARPLGSSHPGAADRHGPCERHRHRVRADARGSGHHRRGPPCSTGPPELHERLRRYNQEERIAHRSPTPSDRVGRSGGELAPVISY